MSPCLQPPSLLRIVDLTRPSSLWPSSSSSSASSSPRHPAVTTTDLFPLLGRNWSPFATLRELSKACLESECSVEATLAPVEPSCGYVCVHASVLRCIRECVRACRRTHLRIRVPPCRGTAMNRAVGGGGAESATCRCHWVPAGAPGVRDKVRGPRVQDGRGRQVLCLGRCHCTASPAVKFTVKEALNQPRVFRPSSSHDVIQRTPHGWFSRWCTVLALALQVL